MGEAIGLVEDFAPEHLTLAIKDARQWAETIKNAGAIFIGNYSPVAAGDFIAGPSHVLPTGGAAKAFSGLTIDQFFRRTSVVEYPERALHARAQAHRGDLRGGEARRARALGLHPVRQGEAMSATGKRRAEIKRKTGETDIALKLLVDGGGRSTIATGIPFFDHMLTLFAKHALFDLDVKVKGDLEVDFHHTVEDTGIVLGQALAQRARRQEGHGALREFPAADGRDARARGARFQRAAAAGLARAEGRRTSTGCAAGDFPAQLTVEFLRAFAQEAGLTLHVEVLYSSETHHLIEAVFKGLARAIEQAVRRDPRVKGIPSTKGML